VGWGKVACWSTKATISVKRVKIEEKYMGGLRNSPLHRAAGDCAMGRSRTVVVMFPKFIFCLLLKGLIRRYKRSVLAGIVIVKSE